MSNRSTIALGAVSGALMGGALAMGFAEGNSVDARRAAACIEVVDEVGPHPLLSDLSPVVVDVCDLDDVRGIKNEKMPHEYQGRRVEMPLRADLYDIAETRNTTTKNIVTVSIAALAAAAAGSAISAMAVASNRRR